MKLHLAYSLKPSFRTLLFFLVAGMFLFSCEENKEEVKPSSEASITSLTLTVGDTDYAITFTNKEGKITLPYSTPLPVTATVKAVVLSAKAKGVKVGDTLTIPASGPLTLTVTAEDDKTTGVYTLTVEKVSASKEASITTLTLTVGDADYDITFEGTQGSVTLPSGTSIPTAVGVKEIALSAGAMVLANDDELPVTDNMVILTVTAEDGATTQNYTVAFSVAANEGASITSLTLTVESADYDITFEGTQSSVTLPSGTSIPTAVGVKEIVLSDGATSVAGNGIGLSVINNAVTITVTAEDGMTESKYTVTFSVAVNSEASVISLILTVEDTDYEIMFEDRQDTLMLLYGTALPTAVGVKEIMLSVGAASDAGTELSVTDNAVTITVTSEDGTTTQEYRVTLVVSQAPATGNLFTSFKFTAEGNEAMALEEADRKEIAGTIDNDAKSITFPKQSAYVYPDRLKASFTTSLGATVQVGGADQVSGVTEQDFSSPVSYVVRAQDGTETTYTVTLTKSTMATIPDAQFRAKLKEFVPAAFTEDQLNIMHDDVVTYNGKFDLRNQTPKLTSVKGVEFFTTLMNLTCSTNALTSLDVSKNRSLDELYCDKNALTSLDVSKNTALTALNCGDNSLRSLDVSSNTALTQLNCYTNELTSLDLSANTALTILDCGFNSLTFLDITGMRSLSDVPGALVIGTGVKGHNAPLATLRVNTALQDNGEIDRIKSNRREDLTVITVNDAGTVVCNDYAPAQNPGEVGSCNDN